ncbi:Pmr5/Cas1p GDSL/SGNH-like acyl-esterase family protein [Trifolium pratense]|uniref:Pmr5/Cas1p GDSL/SGNH-like acyl-esterase family protein n=1 Tax=Trifolium pratense TaxID=57577 RepID=A0A2K3P384_TRIPR|nr:Pmr5/Cas1p GDSL/SGNH-like acyl-esterase family protein [Trifolium pratense]PNY09727.1 Pmr5/Cas1p GDSL/SGNH-like acyl-esterase family protein [Trifolium pratense]PNY09756.1 Pmr5/Cas1p GDSL/SGNH-like acyl-esterase family protein [Trifolium pratense]
MVDSPVPVRHRLLTRPDSMRFFPSRGGAIIFTYSFTVVSILFMLFLVNNAFHPSRRNHFSKVLSHIFNNSTFAQPPSYTPHITNDTTKNGELVDGSFYQPPSYTSHSTNDNNTHNQSSHSNKDGKFVDHRPASSQMSRKEGSGLAPKRSKKRKRKHGKLYPPIPARIKPQEEKSFSPMPSPNARVDSKNVMQSDGHCDMYEGSWVYDDSYPLYKPGSCPHIDEPFNCFLNGRRDNKYEKYRWQPKNCNMPRFNGNDMLEMLRGKRLVFVGDSLNRNMWESMVCVLSNSVENKSSIFEASGRQEFRTEDSYSFIFTDYNCSVEFFRSPFLVQEWEVPSQKGSKKETLRLDLVERSCDKYKNADVLIFNTGHWWTHTKTMEGKEYYQEGNHVHGLLTVEEAITKAFLTWSHWVDTNIDPKKTTVFFRGYSPSHFRGGEWNSGGQCNETEPMKTAPADSSENPDMMKTIGSVIKRMKTPVFYLNISTMTDLRPDAHPSMYRNANMSEETKKFTLTHQDCSHWCLPGVPDLWNELVYAHLLQRMKRNKGNP